MQFRIALACVALCWVAHAQADPTSRSWNQPVAPFRIVGNLYYVGASDVTSFLITSRAGHVVLDGGFAETAPQVLANIRTLGFKPEEVKWLLNSHAHLDHAGGLAGLKRATGAQVAASAADAVLLRAGGRNDPVFGDKLLFPAVTPDRILADGERVAVGETVLTAHVTAGHTHGCTTWTMPVSDSGRTYRVTFMCSTSIVANEVTPIAAEYERTFQTLRALPTDIFLAPHGRFFRLAEKAAALRAGAGVNPFVDPQGYKEFLDSSEASFRRRLKQEQTE